MVASESAPLSELDKQVEIKLAYWFKYPNQGTVPIIRKGGLTMSTSVEAVAAATAIKVDSTPEIRIQGPSAGSGDGRRGESMSPGSNSLPANFPQSSKERPAYLIKWSRFEDQLSSAFAELFCSEHFADVTLACDSGVVLKAHKIILAMSSPFFRRIFVDTPCKHPIIVLKEFSAQVMRNILQYLYMGKVVLNDNEISSFMDAADFFGICGVIPDHYSCDIFATTIKESEQTRYSEKEPQSETDTKLSEGSRTSENEELSDIRDSQLVIQDNEEATESQQSPVIKYHGVKARWTRRYSNTSFPGAQSVSTTNKEHKRSASAGEVESVPRTMEQAQSPECSSKIPRLVDDLKQPLHDLERPSRGDVERLGEHSIARNDELEEGRRRKIIQRAYPKDYSSNTFSNAEDSSDVSADEWKNQGQLRTTYIPPSAPTTSAQRTIRPTPYILGAKDFSHPLQVSVDTPKQSPLYGISSTSSGVLDPGKSKSHSGFTLYTSPHSLPPQMRSALRPDQEFTQTSATTSHLTTSHGTVERSPLRYRQLSPGTSTTTSPTPFRQQEYPPRSHFSLLSTQGWAFQDNHHRHRHHYEDSRADSVERRFRSESLDRGLGHFSNVSLRGTVNKPHSYPVATDLTVPASQQYALGYIPQLRSPSSLPASTNTTRPKTKAIRSSQVPQSSRYTAAEVDQMVDAVANYPGNIVPCTLCQKFVKRERLRAHIHECHLLTGEKIICPHCGIALKSKGSFRVHIWRHKRGALPTRSTMSDFEGGRPPSPSHTSGPASH